MNETGGGIKDIFSFKTRQSFSSADQKVLNMYGDKKIIEIKVVRTPIQKWIDTIIKIASFGRFQKEAQKKGYDELMHLYMLIFVEGLEDQPILFEKNSTPRLTLDIPKDKYINDQTQSINIPIPTGKDITLKELISNAQTNMGETFWKYSWNQLNCQDAIARTLKASGLLTPESEKFIIQDVLNIGRTLHPVVQKGFQLITDTDAYIRKILGKGLY